MAMRPRGSKQHVAARSADTRLVTAGKRGDPAASVSWENLSFMVGKPRALAGA
jgi:hypothetical protein